MNNICHISPDKLPFELFGLCLQEPNSFILNFTIAITCFIAYYKLTSFTSPFHHNWKMFFLLMGCSTFLGGFGHVFFQYTGIYGKLPVWILAICSAYYSGKAMISLGHLKVKSCARLHTFLIVKFIIFMTLMVVIALLYKQNTFVYVMADAGITYMVFCLGFGLYYWKKGLESFKFIWLSVFVLILTIFIYIFNVSFSIYFNQEDFSHILIIISIILFYYGVKGFHIKNLKDLKFSSN